MKLNFNPEIWLVERKPFNPEQWLNIPARVKPKVQPTPTRFENDIHYEVEIVIERIEAQQIDLTCNYGDWIKMGFAFASEFGEVGRNYFQRISRFHPGYNNTSCDRQFDNCLKGNKTGVSIKSFFSAARDAGINVYVKPK